MAERLGVEVVAGTDRHTCDVQQLKSSEHDNADAFFWDWGLGERYMGSNGQEGGTLEESLRRICFNESIMAVIEWDRACGLGRSKCETLSSCWTSRMCGGSLLLYISWYQKSLSRQHGQIQRPWPGLP